jgi:hypothetical protein
LIIRVHAIAGRDGHLGFGRIVALHHRSSTAHHLHKKIRCLYLRNDDAAEPYGHLEDQESGVRAVRLDGGLAADESVIKC